MTEKTESYFDIVNICSVMLLGLFLGAITVIFSELTINMTTGFFFVSLSGLSITTGIITDITIKKLNLQISNLLPISFICGVIITMTCWNFC